jgi:tRNA modification GTPase
VSSSQPTIFALSSGPPPSAIAVIRVSGPRARIALEAMIGRVPEPRRATLAKVRDPATSEVIDEGLALWFPGPKSETGEDMAELQVHGGRAVIAAVLNALAGLDGFRLAEPGEFTRRAFEHGRMDLTAVEGLADLVAAETEAQRKQALRQLRGNIAEQAEAWRTRLIEARALIEAGIDFSDEGDVPKNLAREALAIIRPVADEIAQAGHGHGERLRDGLQLAIAGAPNVGKSTLLNRFAKRDAAIVSPYAGTTRDVIEVHLDLKGFPITIRDTAGIRPTEDPVEQEGVRRARQSAAAADLVLWVLDVRDVGVMTAPVADQGQLAHTPVCFVLNKTDLLDATTRGAIEALIQGPQPAHALPQRGRFLVSAVTGEGVDNLIEAIAKFAGEFFRAEAVLITRERHRQMLQEASAALAGALALDQAYGVEGREEVIAEQVRMATRALERLTGRVDVEDVLDVIFREFCVGK